MLSTPEISKLRHFTETNEDIKKYSYGRDDGTGRVAKICLWNYPGNDVTGVVARYAYNGSSWYVVYFSMLIPGYYFVNFC